MESASPVLSAVLQGEYLAGVKTHEALPGPTAEDDRWLGLCLHNLGRHFEAKLRLAGAVSRGHPSANIELATLYRMTGLDMLAETTLDLAFADELSNFDRALALRERGAQALQKGDLVNAVRHLETAWVDSQGTFAGSSLGVPIAQLLGTVLADLGREVEAVQYFTYALPLANASRRVYLNAAYARSLIYLGQFGEADKLLDSAVAGGHHVPLSRALLVYYRGVLARARGAVESAEEYFSQAAALSFESGETQIECFARLGLCALATAAGDVQLARRQIARASTLADDARLGAYVLWREGMLKASSGDSRGADLLKAAASAFHDLSLRREEMWVWASIGEACLHVGNRAAALEALDRATDLRYAFVTGGPIAIELRYLPKTLELLQSPSPERAGYSQVLWDDFQSVQGSVPAAVEIITLGNVQLRVAGKGVRLDLARSVEILTYLLEHPGVRLEQIQLDLFPEVEHRTSKSYIHQARRELEHAVPGLRIPYDRADQTYTVRSPEIELHWDLADFRRTLNARDGMNLIDILSLYRGPFLPKADGHWAGIVRGDLQRWIIRIGLETLDEWQSQGDYRKCLDLALRLTEIEPLDEGLNMFLLKAMLVVEGQIATSHMYRKIRERYEDEFGEVPPLIERYQGGVRMTN